MRHPLIALAGVFVFVAPIVTGRIAAQQAPPQEGGGVQVGVPQGRGGAAPTRGRGRETGPPRPAPRSADGRALLGVGATPTEKGIWLPGPVIPDPLGLKGDVPLQPWARAIAADRRTHQLEPHARCKPSGVARVFLTPYGVEIVERPDLQRIYIFDIGGPHTFRTIYLDGRGHPAKRIPDYYGHSIGWWEGDTLVVETTGFNEGFWIDRGALPHTEQLKTARALHASRHAHHRLRTDHRRSGGLHQAVHRPPQSDLGSGHRAVRIHVPGSQLRPRADGRSGEVSGPDERDRSLVAWLVVAGW